jgi:hypothetical protein
MVCLLGSLDHVCMCDGVSQPSTAELALGTKNTHRKYCFHGPGSLNSVRLVLQATLHDTTTAMHTRHP